MSETRGIRNHNPGNIRHSSDKWLGEVQGSDKAFKTFSTPVYGIRALAKLLLNYERKYSLNTISGLISRWAPTNENDTTAYVRGVATACGVDPYQPIDVPAYLTCLVPAIIKHENGSQPYSMETIEQGINLALGGGGEKSAQDVATAPPQPAAHRIENGKVLPVGDSPLVVEKMGESVPGNRPVTTILSKKLTLAVLGLLAVILNQPLGLGLNDQQMGDLVKLVSAYVLGQAGVDAFAPVVKALVGGKS